MCVWGWGWGGGVGNLTRQTQYLTGLAERFSQKMKQHTQRSNLVWQVKQEGLIEKSPFSRQT